MCCLFGLLDYGHTLTEKQTNRIISTLAAECEARGTDATGIAYNSGGKLCVYKRPLPAHRMRFRIPTDARLIMGHTRMTTQGSEKKNYNNHPFLAGPYISDLYLSTYVENQFLSVVRGLETYHRWFCERKALDDADLSEARSDILDFIKKNTPTRFQDYFISRVCHTDEMSLRSRLNELLKELPTGLSEHLFGPLTSNARAKMIQKIIDTRNYYTHRDNIKKYPNVIQSGLEVSNFADRLAAMLIFFCLTHLGLNRDVVAERLIKWR